MTEVIPNLPSIERDGKIYIGEGVKFERIRRITGYLWVRWTASTMPRKRNFETA